jgi:DNA-nicking Smr family endonuclease
VRAGIAGLDRRTAERLRRGQLEIEATLDLHGYRLEEARRALSRFIATSQASGRRCVLVVTGKGAPGSKETIRALVPRWLADGVTSTRVLAVAPARPKDGGGGALYVLLRKHKREPAGGKR